MRLPLPAFVRPALATAVAILAIASPAKARRDRQAEAAALVQVPGAKAQSCIPITGIRETRVRDDRTIDFYMRGRTIYRVTLPYACPRLGFEEAFGYETSLSQLCSTDIIRVINRGGGGIAGASCGLDVFQPVAKAR